MSFIKWADWTKPRAWRKLAEEHTDELGQKYVVIGQKSDDENEPYELLQLSRYSAKYDSNKSVIHTPIREFDAKPVEMSRRTRDLGVARFITDKGKPIFVLEPGADVLKWTAIREGITEMELVNIARRGEVGRAVRRKDRLALKASKQEGEAKIQAHQEHIQKLERDLAQAKVDLNGAKDELNKTNNKLNEANDAQDKMVKNIVRENECNGKAQSKSGSMGCALGMAQERGFKAVTNKPLPGSFGG